MHSFFRLALASSFVLPTLALGQTAPADTVTAAPAASPWTFYGYVDAYYGYDFNRANSPQRPAFLYSHNRQNEFTVNHGLVGARYQDERVRASLALQAGTYVEANYAAETPVMRPVYEAYAGFRPTRRSWLDLGIFTSHLGFESAISKDNWTLTRSLMAENSPYFESGARFTYEASPKLTLTGLVLNGWQNIRENNRGKAVGTQVQWKPAAKWVLNSSTFVGNEQPQDSARRRRYFHDFYASYAATSRLSLAVVFDIGQQQAPGRAADTWHTGAAFVRYAFAERWTAAARAEYYSADHGVIIAALAPAAATPNVLVRGASLNLDYAPARQVLVRLEGRVLRAGQPLFADAAALPTRTYGNGTASVSFGF
ncbi:porin [Hymenobacter antarcticus]|uniref:Porin n=1 Tax=Hymenobacter antarcticus TaxID=486270 RepID=A0ABP7P464_9BACT